MLASEMIILTSPVYIETHTDAERMICTEEDLQKWISRYGDQEIIYDEKYNVYRVPALQEAIQSFSVAKMRACERFGCE